MKGGKMEGGKERGRVEGGKERKNEGEEVRRERETEGEMGEDAEKVGKVIKFLTW